MAPRSLSHPGVSLGVRLAVAVGVLGVLYFVPTDVPAAVAIAWSVTILFGSLVVAAVGGLVESGGLADRVLKSGAPRRGSGALRKTREAK